MESDFARGEAANKAEIAFMREKIEKKKEGIEEDLIDKLQQIIDNTQDDFASGAVEPIKDCPHTKPDNIIPLRDLVAKGVKCTDPCKVCGEIGEMWVCLKCGDVLCSRFV